MGGAFKQGKIVKKKVCRVYGLIKKDNPLIFRNDGKLIGSS